MYGDEETGILPTQLYTEPYAKKAFEDAKFVVENVEKLLEGYLERIDTVS